MSEDATLDEFVDNNNSGGDTESTQSATDVSRVEDYISIIKGTKPDRVIDSPSDGSEPYLVVSTLTGEERRYTPDTDGPKATPRDTLMIMDGSKSGRVYHGESGVIGSTMAAIRPEAANPHYLRYFLESKFERLNSATKGSAVPHTDKDLLRSLEIPAYSLTEQRKIATVLYTVDRAIEKTEEIVNQTERVKAGLTQDLLKNGINNQQVADTDSRFGLLPESWELQPLKSVGEVVGRTAPEKDDSECWGGEIPWATPSEITSLVGQTINDTDEHLTELALEKVSSNLIPPMSVLMTTRATIGECAVNTVEMTTNQGFKNVIPGQNLDTWYTYYRLDYERDYLASLSKGSTFPEVGKDTVENFVIPIPPIEEQREIGEVLRSVDEQILSYKQSKSQYQRLKRGLMQDLFSGTVRTTDTTIEVPDDIAQYG